MAAETEQEDHSEYEADDTGRDSGHRNHEEQDDSENDECECCADHALWIPCLHLGKHPSSGFSRACEVCGKRAKPLLVP
jgi:hypothetical protein